MRPIQPATVIRCLVCVGHVIGLFGLVGSCLAEEAERPSVLRKPFLEASAAELLALAAEAAPMDPDAAVVYLLDECLFRVDTDGRITTTNRLIYQCRTAKAFESYGEVRTLWHPWYEKRPDIAARVISPDGKEHILNRDTIEEITLPSMQPNVFTDRKALRAPLPSLTPGCVVESCIISCEDRPVCKAAATAQYILGQLGAPTAHVRVTLETPVSRPVVCRLLSSTAVLREEIVGDQRLTTVDAGPVPDLLDDWQSLLPGNTSPLPLFAFSSGGSWGDVAREYATLVEGQLEGSDLKSLAREVTGVQGPPKEVPEAARALLQYLHGRTRYTGVEFGAAAIVPRQPAETLTRGYGDCKDLSTLLVALLRAIEIPAHVALLSSGPGLDTIPELPGLSQFDHVIVFVDGPQPLWIDPTARFTTIGEWPPGIQGRFALVIAESTEDLKQIPRSNAQANQVVATHVLKLSESQAATLSTVTEYQGAFAPLMRDFFASTTQDQQAKFLGQRGLAEYGTEKLSRFSCSPPFDLGQRFRIEADYEEVALAAVQHPEAIAIIRPGFVLEFVSNELIEYPDTAQQSPTHTAAGQPLRKHPLQFPFPFRHQVQLRIEPPRGYVPQQLPANEEVELGPARLRMQYRAAEANSVIADISFESGDRDFSAEEVAATRRRIAELSEQQGYQAWQVAVRFEQTAGKLLKAGRIKEAVREYHRLLQHAEQEATCHAEFATAVLQLGLGDLARRHARRAVELAPHDAYCQNVLAHTLTHNRIGMPFADGFDRDGAIAAYRRALELDPDDVDCHNGLATVLLHDPDGSLDYRQETAGEAVRELLAAYEKRKDDSVLDYLISAMLSLGQNAQARELLENEQTSDVRDALLLIVIAKSDGVESCLQRAVSLKPDQNDRESALLRAVDTLNWLGEYDTAIALAKAVAAGSPQKELLLQRVDQLSLMQKHEDEEPNKTGPQSVVRAWLTESFIYGMASERPRRFIANPPQDPDTHVASEIPTWLYNTQLGLDRAELSAKRRADAVNQLGFEVAGVGAIGNRVRVFAKISPQLKCDVYVVRHEPEYRIYWTGEDDAEIGVLALRLLEEDRVDDARQWLTWAYEGQRRSMGWLGAFADAPFVKLWSLGNKERDDLKLTAAVLAVRSESSGDAVSFLESLPQDLVPTKRLQVDRTLCVAYARQNEFAKAASTAAMLADLYPTAEEPTVYRLMALAAMEDIESLELLVAKQRSRQLKNTGLLCVAEAATGKGDYPKATDCLRRLMEKKEEIPVEMLAYVAWLSCFQDPAPEGQLDWARAAFQAAYAETDDRHTQGLALAAWAVSLAHAGRLTEAVELLPLAPEIDAGQRPIRLDFYVLGRIAEECGLKEHAMELYRSIGPYRHQLPNSVHDLAVLRLRKIAPQVEHANNATEK